MSGKDSPHPIDVHVGARLRFRRKQLQISQARLGEGLHVTFQQVQKYERGVNRVSASMLFLAGQQLDVGVDYFFHGLPDQPGGNGALAADAEILAAADAVPAIRTIGRLSAKAQSALQQVIAALESRQAKEALDR